MTAIIAVGQKNALHILSDAATHRTDRPEALSSIGSKIRRMPWFNAVVLGTGSALFTDLVADALADQGDFDDAIVFAREAVEDIYARLHDVIPDYMPDCCEVYILGWSGQHDKPELHTWSTRERKYPSMPARIMCGLAYPMFAKPNPEPTYMKSIGWKFFGDLERFDPKRDGIAIMEGQRRIKTEVGSYLGEGRYAVGGFIEHVVIRRNSVQSAILHTWPEDRVGFPIMPVQ